MKPINFKESNAMYRKPDSMTAEECGTLPVSILPDGRIVSCWKMTWKERLSALFFGKTWVAVYSDCHLVIHHLVYGQ